MHAVLSRTDGHAVFENPIPQGLTSHAPKILFHGHYSVLPKSPVGLRNSPPFALQLPKGKDGRTQFFCFSSLFLTRI